MVHTNASVCSRGVGVGVGRNVPANAYTCLSGCGYCGFWGENPAFFPIDDTAVLGAHLGPPLSKAFRKPQKTCQPVIGPFL